MRRRGFVQMSAAVSALAASGRLPLLFAAEDTDRSSAGLSAIEPISSAVREFVVKNSPIDFRTDYELTYDVFRWHGKEEDGTVKNLHTGTLQIKRHGNDTAAHCEVSKNLCLPNGQDVFLRAALEVAGVFDLPRSWTVERWETDPEKAIQEAARMRLSGEVNDGEVLMRSGETVILRQTVREPLLSQWSIPALLAAGRVKKSPLSFCMLEEAVKIKPAQKIEYCGKVSVPTAQGTGLLDAYLQTGYGILPVHWLVDAGGRTQLMTHSVLNWALAGIK